MTATSAEPARVLRSLPGRARMNVPRWSGVNPSHVERGLRQIPGVRQAQANPVTRNVLVIFEPDAVAPGDLIAALDRLADEADRAAEPGPPTPRAGRGRPPVVRDRASPGGRARIAVRGLDRDPDIGRRVVERLEDRPDVVRAKASPLTGRVLVEFAAAEVDLEDLLSEVAQIELPAVPGEDTPHHPLDPAPLVSSTIKAAGALAGLGALAARRALGARRPPVTRRGPAEAAAAIGIVEGLPPLANRVRAALGPTGAEVLFGGVGIASLALSGNALGLAVAGAAALRLATEVRARRAAWIDYERRLPRDGSVHPGAVLHLDAGERVPLAGRVVHGFGTAAGDDGLPRPLAPGARIEAGAKLFGGPFTVELEGAEPFDPAPRPAGASPSAYDLYMRFTPLVSTAYAGVTAIVMRSPARALTALLLVNPRAALIGRRSADTGAAARVLRSGVTIVGTRADRPVRRPDTVLIDAARVLTDGLELGTVAAAADGGLEADDVLAIASGVAAAAGSPWGGAFPLSRAALGDDGAFDGTRASAEIDGVRWALGPAASGAGVSVPPDALALTLTRAPGNSIAGHLTLRPRLALGVDELAQACDRRGVRLAILSRTDDPAAAAVADRAGVALLQEADPVRRVRALQARGEIVAYLADSARAAECFAASDLAVALTSGRSGAFGARADLLAPTPGAAAAIVEAGARRDAAVRDSAVCSAAGNVVGAAWGLRGAPGLPRASAATYVAALAVIADGVLRLRGGRRARSVAERLSDPAPERWGRVSVEEAMRRLGSSAGGLSNDEALRRRQPTEERRGPRGALAAGVIEQLRSPLTGFLAAGAALSLVLGATADMAMIAAVIGANAVVSAWEQRQTGRALDALERVGARRATVLRDGRARIVPASAVVVGDILALAPGDRVAADARLIATEGLEVDEAALTGESLPVRKGPNGGSDASRIVLDGSDVTVGTARAVAVAVGADTRMGATASALAMDENDETPLGARLARMLRQAVPVIAIGGTVVTVAGLLWGQPLLPQLALGASIAIAAVPEGLPLLAGVAQASVARRLARRGALVRRLSAVEALGRVDVLCADKTGTLTEGRLALTVVTDVDGRSAPPDQAPPDLSELIFSAALASPHPEAHGAKAHPTDVAVLNAAADAGLTAALQAEARRRESAFDPVRSFHATVAGGKLHVKGAPEALVPRCTRVRRGGRVEPLDDAGRRALLERAESLSEKGLRILLVAQGDEDSVADDPQELVALGFLGISDPLRATVPAAIRRCHDAGVRVVMLTGDHPATARWIGEQAGLSVDDGTVLTAAEIADMTGDELERNLDRATVIARMTPLDKVWIVERLQARGHVVAMTGDGVNDAPALRLADVGVALGAESTEVARHAADLWVGDEDVSPIVEALVEGRGFWRNIRRSLALLFGGNLGEIGLVAGASVAGLGAPLTTRQVLAVNLLTDVLPAVAVAVQEPEHRDLSGLAREGTTELGAPLRNEVLRRGVATAAPSLAAFVLARRGSSLAQARGVAFGSIVATQLGQTLAMGRVEGRLTGPVRAAVLGSAAALAAMLTIPPLQSFLGLATPTPAGVALILGATAAAVLISGMLSAGRGKPDIAAAPA